MARSGRSCEVGAKCRERVEAVKAPARRMCMIGGPQPETHAMLSTHDVECPYCGEPISLVADGSGGAQCYIEDCQVCCRPITVILDVLEDGEVDLRVQSESEA